MSSISWKSLNPYELHKTLINTYLSTPQRNRSNFKTDFDVIRENHKFLWDEKDEKNLDTWEKRLAKKYYDKLFREYCIVDLSRYKENKFGLRWRTERELISGQGQFSCGNKKCEEKEDLKTWEVNFGYVEEGEKKNALVKLRLCPRCSYKLNYTHKKREVKRLKKRLKHKDKPSTLNRPESSEETESIDKEDVEEKQPNYDKMEENDTEIWKSKTSPEEEKSREEEFEEYLEDLFL